jgi:predicted nucleic acid-binding Zn finger protein
MQMQINQYTMTYPINHEHSIEIDHDEVQKLVNALNVISDLIFQNHAALFISIDSPLLPEFVPEDVHEDMQQVLTHINLFFKHMFDLVDNEYLRIENSSYTLAKQVVTGDTHPPDDSQSRELAVLKTFTRFSSNFIMYFIDLYPPASLFGPTMKNAVDEIISVQQDLIRDNIIAQNKQQNICLIKVPSTQKSKYTKGLYLNKLNNLKVARVPIKKKTYVIDVKHNACNCPDFRFRKQFSGLSCKHLMTLKNKTKCLQLITQIHNELLYNVPIPMKQMLKEAYTDEIDYICFGDFPPVNL